MTNDELKAIRARAEAATPGPWEADITGEIYAPDQSSVCMVLMSDVGQNAAFIAHGRTDTPALLDEVERLREEVAARDIQIAVMVEQVRGAATDMQARATRAKAHAERLAEGLEALTNGLEAIMPFAKDGMDFTLADTLVDQARQALSAYRGGE